MTHVAGTPDEAYVQTLAHFACMASGCCIFSPMGSMFTIMRYGASGKELVGLCVPYFFYFCQCLLWSFYGIFSHHHDICRINVLGTTMCAMYLAIMANYAQPKDRAVIRPVLGMACAVLVTGSLTLVTFDEQTRLKAFSHSATLFAVLLNVAPCVQIMEVIKSRSTDGFPVALTAAGFLSAVLWSEYAIVLHDIPFLMPNLLGVLMNGAQIGVVCWVYAQTMTEVMEEQQKAMAPLVQDGDRHKWEDMPDYKRPTDNIVQKMQNALYGQKSAPPKPVQTQRNRPADTGSSCDLML